MGMSASQARFLMLTARKNDVEFEGQQINQQRTTLSNESASYYSELCNMVVPTPPSIDDYTKVSYTFDDGALTNTITTMIAKNDGKYSINYVQQWQDDYSIVSASSSMIAKTQAGEYKVGATTLRELGKSNGVITGSNMIFNGKTVEFDENNRPYITEMKEVTETVELTDEEVKSLKYFSFSSAADMAAMANLDMSKITRNENPDGSVTFTDGTNEVKMLKHTKNDDGTFDNNLTLDESEMLVCLIDTSAQNLADQVKFVTKNANDKYQKDVTTEKPEKRFLSPAEIAGLSNYDDPYLASLSSEQIVELLEQEEYYRVMLNEKRFNNPQSDEKWYVRYVKDATKGNYVPYFYNKNDVEGADYPANGGFATENINCFSIGSSTKTKEIINALATVEKDTSGRYIALLLYKTDENGSIVKDENGNDIYTQYSLTTNTAQDEEAYNDALNRYNYEQHQYDQKVQEINSKIEVVQQQDKTLELELKQLDTEENALSTELEAVKKVITKNIESSFKTFNA